MTISKIKSEDKKIGIIAPFKDYNYGTVLQAYALYFHFKKLGINAEYIDYMALDGSESILEKGLLCIRHPSILFRKLFKKQAANPIVTFFSTDTFKAIKEGYDSFIACIPSSKRTTYRTLKQLESNYASFCVGSDQTWSPYVVDILSINLLPFVKDKRKKNSYAPSIGTTLISKDYKKKLKKNLSDFNVISCRDFYGSRILSDILGRVVYNVLDPTLLMTKEEWQPLMESIKSPDKYVLCYQLGIKDSLLRFARKIKNEKGLNLVIIPTNEYTSAQPESLSSVSPGQFLYLVKNACYVVTGSFHGTIFSINFGVQFFSFAKVEGDLNSFDNSRIAELLDSFGMKDRFMEGLPNECMPADLDYLAITDELKMRRERSQCIINKIAETV